MGIAPAAFRSATTSASLLAGLLRRALNPIDESKPWGSISERVTSGFWWDNSPRY
jgi:hypothetical protein